MNDIQENALTQRALPITRLEILGDCDLFEPEEHKISYTMPHITETSTETQEGRKT
jgi:hypothetical protein